MVTRVHLRLFFLVALAFVAVGSHPRQSLAQQPPVVCIDPGHPSETSAGAVVQNGTTEVHIAWVVAQKLRALLEARGVRTVMTKSAENQLVRNRDRAIAANRARAALTEVFETRAWRLTAPLRRLNAAAGRVRRPRR